MADIIPAGDPYCADEAVRLLRMGDLVCYPTDTLYGLGAAATNDTAVRRLYGVKGRSAAKPLPLLVNDVSMAGRIAEISPVAHTLIRNFWPGGLTIVMRKVADFHSVALARQETVAVRMPDYDLVRTIISGLNEPLTGTSANRSGGRAPTTAQEAAFQLGEMVALVVDGGPARAGEESTVIDTTDSEGPKVIRDGIVGREELERALGRAVA